MLIHINTPGTAGGPDGRARTLAVKSQKHARKSVLFCKTNYYLHFFLHISSCYAKIFGETNFHTREIPRSGSKAKDGEKRKKEERENDGNNNGQATLIV